MGCLFDCGKNQSKSKNKNKIDLSFLNITSNDFINTIPNSSLDYSSRIEHHFIFDISLGEGTFGFSMKIIEKSSKKEFSLKILPKDNIINLSNINNIKIYYENNRKILIDSSYINRILNTYENEDNFFLIRELAPLTLKTKINNSKLPFQLNEVKNIMFQLLKCVKYLHSNNIIHGNIKPENILLFDKNMIKLEDFSHFLYFQRNNKFNDFLFCSPEIIEKIPNEKCDEWSLGIIMYCLLCGKYPFNGNSKEELSNNILNNNFEQGEEFKKLSLESQELINKFLTHNPKFRINAEDALTHKFFEKSEEYFLLKSESSSNGSDKISNQLEINSLIKIYFIFIIIFGIENNFNELFLNYILGSKFLVENEKWKILKFVSDNLISYEEEDVKHIINYLYNNKIYLFGDNLKTIFLYFCECKNSNKQTLKIQYIIDSLKKLFDNINCDDLNIPNDIISKDLIYEEFKYIISNNL